jgi:hypothetical protein
MIIRIESSKVQREISTIKIKRMNYLVHPFCDLA